MIKNGYKSHEKMVIEMPHQQTSKNQGSPDPKTIYTLQITPAKKRREDQTTFSHHRDRAK